MLSHIGRTLLLFASATYGFDVEFNSADHCLGSTAGTFTGSIGTPSGCQTSYNNADGDKEKITAPGGNFNVIIDSEGKDINAGVAFYGLKDCRVLIGFGNVKSCLGTGYFSSFQVIDIDAADDQLKPVLDPVAVASLEVNATVTASDDQALSTPASASATASSSSSSSSSAAAAEDTNQAKVKRDEAKQLSARSAEPQGVSHGATLESRGQTYKYHQLSSRTWRGVPIDQWNPKIHKRNTSPLPLPKSHPHQRRGASTPNPASTLSKRAAIVPETCNLVRSCMISTTSSSTLPITSAGPSLLSALHEHSKDSTDWQFLLDPFVVELVNEENTSQGFIYAQTIYHSDVAPCVGGEGAEAERAALEAALVEGVDGTDVGDLRVDLKVGLSGVPGATNSLFVSTRSAGEKELAIRPVCAAIEVFD